MLAMQFLPECSEQVADADYKNTPVVGSLAASKDTTKPSLVGRAKSLQTRPSGHHPFLPYLMSARKRMQKYANLRHRFVVCNVGDNVLVNVPGQRLSEYLAGETLA